MNIGNLYTVKKWFWLLYPTKETAAHPLVVAMLTDAATVAPDEYASYWSKRFNCEVTYFSPDSYIVFLEEDGELKKLLTSDGKIGWVCFVEDYNDCFEEVKHP